MTRAEERGEDRMGKRVGNKNKNGNKRMNKSHGLVKIGPLKRRKRRGKNWTNRVRQFQMSSRGRGETRTLGGAAASFFLL